MRKKTQTFGNFFDQISLLNVKFLWHAPLNALLRRYRCHVMTQRKLIDHDAFSSAFSSTTKQEVKCVLAVLQRKWKSWDKKVNNRFTTPRARKMCAGRVKIDLLTFTNFTMLLNHKTRNMIYDLVQTGILLCNYPDFPSNGKSFMFSESKRV